MDHLQFNETPDLLRERLMTKTKLVHEEATLTRRCNAFRLLPMWDNLQTIHDLRNNAKIAEIAP